MDDGTFILFCFIVSIFGCFLVLLLETSKSANSKKNNNDNSSRRMDVCRTKYEIMEEEKLEDNNDSLEGLVSRETFNDIDKDNDGLISVSEFYTMSEDDCLKKILEYDKKFSKDEFYDYVRIVFLTVIDSINKKDSSLIRAYESNDMYLEHKMLIDNYISTNITRFILRVKMKGVLLKDYKIVGDNQVITVALASSMVDYTTDDKHNVLNGEKTDILSNHYILTFIRNKDFITTDNDNKEITNCPNCGAGIKISDDGNCSYCGTLLVSGKYGWILSDFKKVKIAGHNVNYKGLNIPV